MAEMDTVMVTVARKAARTGGRAVNPPIQRASTILFDTLAEFEAASAQPFDGPYYGRLGTTTTFAFEEAMTAAEGGYRSIATSSGLAAITSTLLAFLGRGDHLLIVDSVYGPARRFCDGMLARSGVEVTYYDPLIGSRIADLIRPNTRMVYMESPGSGTFEVQDAPAIATAARAAGAVTVMDNTWATPQFFRPLAHGVDISIHAATKYIVGHADAMLGVVTTTEEAFKPLRYAVRDLGCCAGSEECNLGLRGLRTLHVRMPRHQESGLALAHWFEQRPEVARVLHPALPSTPGHDMWRRDFAGASGLFAIELQPFSRSAVGAMIDKLELFKIGASWGGYESLVLPAHPEKLRSATSWDNRGPVVRFHAGLEAVSDLIGDLENGFACLAGQQVQAGT